MKARNLLILLILVLGLGAYIYYGIQKPHEAKLEEGDVSGDKVVTLNTEDVVSISLKLKEGEIKLQRETRGDLWQLMEPVRDVASGMKVDNLLAAAKRFRQMKEIWNESKAKERAKDLNQFGLDHPKVTLTLSLPGESESNTIRLGGQNPGFTGTYFQIKEGGAVNLGTLDLDFLATQRADDFREMRITSVNPNDYETIQIERKGQIASFKNVAGNWVMTSPFQGIEVDAEFLRNQAEKISLIRANSFSKQEPSSLKGKKPDILITVGFKEGKTDVRTNKNDQRPHGTEIVLFEVKSPKKTADDSSDTYFAKSDKTEWASIAKFHFENLARQPEEYVKKTFDNFLISDVTVANIEPVGKNNAFRIEKKDGNYDAIRGEQSQKADTGKVENLLRQLRNLRAMRFIDFQSNSPKNPSLSVHLTLQGNENRSYVFEIKKDLGELYVPHPTHKWARYLLNKDAIKVTDFSFDHLGTDATSTSVKKAEEKSK